MTDLGNLAPAAAAPLASDITPMNQQVLCFGKVDLGELDASAIDQHIDRTIQALFDDIQTGGTGADPCMNYYCTGYWPAHDVEIPS